MLLKEFMGYWNSKFTVFLFVALMLVAGGFAHNVHRDAVEMRTNIEQLRDDPEADAWDLQWADGVESSFQGIGVFERFFFNDMGMNGIFFLVFAIGMGVHLGGKTFETMNSSWGTMLMSRMNYRQYLKQILGAQALYLLSFLILFFGVLFVAYLIMFGGGFVISTHSELLSRYGFGHGIFSIETAWQYGAVLGSLILYAGICMLLLIMIATVSPLFIKNKYLVQFLPALVMIGAEFLVFGLGNLHRFFALITLPTLFRHSFDNLIMLLANNRFSSSPTGNLEAIIASFGYPLLLLLVFSIIYRLNVKRIGKDYLV